jgi:ariadne-2
MEMSGEDTDCEDDNYNDYYCSLEDEIEISEKDAESCQYECLRVEEVEKLLNELVELLSLRLDVTPALAKLLLHNMDWSLVDIVRHYQSDAIGTLLAAKVKPPELKETSRIPAHTLFCSVCMTIHPKDIFKALTCGHQFCKDCWNAHFEIQILEGVTTVIGCMAQDCVVLAPEDFVLSLLTRPNIREKYQRFAFRDYVKSHPELRFCPGPNCDIIVRSKERLAKRVVCHQCKSSFCFKCGTDYHAPTDCEVIKRWLTKCADDSETANYISAHTKDCPKCHICIEKNGGCNHMQCYNCKHDFCWMCLGDWKSHGSEYYECSRYKENPNIAYESVHAQAREALKKYLHYYERWENHSKSLRLEEQTLQRIKDRIEVKVMESAGTWIDWQYLLDAANLLAKCRYTLKYTYPYAYYMESGPRKELFEYQQAQLEAEIENLSWKIERAETTDRGELQNQMDIAEKRRSILLKDFLEV